MSDEWIIRCGVRFWGQRGLDQAILTNYVGGAVLGALALVGIVGGVAMIVKAEEWDERLLGAVVFLMSAMLLLAPYMLWSDAACYSS